MCTCNYIALQKCVVALQVIILQKAIQENSIPHKSIQPKSVLQPTVQYVIPNEKVYILRLVSKNQLQALQILYHVE